MPRGRDEKLVRQVKLLDESTNKLVAAWDLAMREDSDLSGVVGQALKLTDRARKESVDKLEKKNRADNRTF